MLRTIGCKRAAVLLSAAALLLIAPVRRPAADETAAGSVALREGSYAAYLAAAGERERPLTALRFGGDTAAAGGGAEVKVGPYEGKENAVIWSNSEGYVEFTVEVERAGLYNMGLTYYPVAGKGADIEFELYIDGQMPFSGCEKIVFPRLYANTQPDFEQDNRGNELRPSQRETPEWMTYPVRDNQGTAVDPYLFLLEAGRHTVRFVNLRDPIVIDSLNVYNEAEPPDYEAYLSGGEGEDLQGDTIRIDAEKPLNKTSSMLYPLADRADPATTPADPNKIRLNTIGGENWTAPTQEITWEFEVRESGYYKIGFRYKQNYLRGLFTARAVRLDGEVPFEELEDVRFDYGISWGFQAVGGADHPMRVYLKKGIHRITMAPTLSVMAEPLSTVDDCVYYLNDIYRKIIMITGSTPDIYRDYYLQEAIPGLLDAFTALSARLRGVADQVFQLTGTRGSEAAMIERMCEQLDSFVKRPDTIPERLENYHMNISSLAAWVLQIRDQQLLLDEIYITPYASAFPATRVSFWKSVVFQAQAFIGAFFQDYSSVGNVFDAEEAVYVWVGSGRDQAEVLKQLIDTDFVKNTGIGVNLSLVQTNTADGQSALMQAVMAGKGPDVALMVGRGYPINLALRGAALALEGFDGYQEIVDGYMASAVLPYELEGHVYGLPETQNFHMMFYRTDIFSELNLQPPETWDELYHVAEVLQRNNMNVGLPYVSLDAYSVVSQGVGGQSIFPALLMQVGGQYYHDDRMKTGLDTPAAYQAFKRWTDFYTKYGFDVYKDDYNRFRTGEMPLSISNYTFYSMLYTAAPEIRNLWKMMPIPGTRREEGTIDRTAGASGSASVVLSAAKNPEKAWAFVRWWLSADIQGRYGTEIESVLGPAGRYNPANVEALSQISWSTSEQKVLTEQWKSVREIPEIPGGYYTSRNVDNAFKAVIYNNENPREALNYWNKQINAEILRKREEFGIGEGTEVAGG